MSCLGRWPALREPRGPPRDRARSEECASLSRSLEAPGFLRGVEGFPVELRFDPDRFGHQTVSTAVDRRAGEPLLEPADSLEAGVAVVVHAASLPTACSPRCPIEHTGGRIKMRLAESTTVVR